MIKGLISKIGKKVGKFIGLLSLFSLPILLQGYTISGRITDIHNPTQGIDSAKVLIIDYNDPANKDSVFTDSNGDYAIEFSGTGIEENEKEKNDFEIINKGAGLEIITNKNIKCGIYDALGRRIKGFNGNNNIYIPTKDFNSGNYFLVSGNETRKFSVGNGYVLGLNKEKTDVEEENLSYLVKPFSFKGSLDSLIIEITKPDSFWPRKTYRGINSDTIIDENMITNDTNFFNITHYNGITDRVTSGGTQRWVMDTIQYMIDTTDMPQAMKDTIVSIINDEVIYMTQGLITPVINFTDTHHTGWPGADTINVHIDNSIPGQGEHGEKSIPGHDGNPYTLETAYVKLKDHADRGTTLQELLQTLGWVNDSDLEPSIFNGGTIYNYLQKADSLSKILYSRPAGNQHPDKDMDPWNPPY